MAIYELEERRRSPGKSPEPVDRAAHPVSTPVDTAPPAQLEGETAEQRYVREIRAELDTYLCRLKTLGSVEPDQVFLCLSSITARLAEVRTHLWRSESRRLAALRSREVDPLIEECDRQFRLHSRVQAVRQMDFEMVKGQP